MDSKDFQMFIRAFFDRFGKTLPHKRDRVLADASWGNIIRIQPQAARSTNFHQIRWWRRAGDIIRLRSSYIVTHSRRVPGQLNTYPHLHLLAVGSFPWSAGFFLISILVFIIRIHLLQSFELPPPRSLDCDLPNVCLSQAPLSSTSHISDPSRCPPSRITATRRRRSTSSKSMADFL